MEPHMKPSSKIAPLAFMAIAALWPVAGVAGPAGHGFAAPPRGPQTIVPNAHPTHAGKIALSQHVRPAARRFQQGAFAYGWPDSYWSGAVPDAYQPAYAEGAQPPFYPGAFYPPPGPVPYAACSKPLIIKIGAEKPPRNLPRVTYGTPSLCPG
jgi:hypothetical protein